ncbi:sensor histidine kinase [Heyndrickxia ginsengihumi]|uniref:sensor histidine kinase n=1 Tax=Heyndrickxia ginsengihumi TaxID=363870 RepID=UPI00203C4EEA|nr:sensor histidine kinase [Heyndrickxia ginsengihumi]MCM3024924.1 sensor histidine kinase [Heyndrickxia ginsengihumi]
MTVENIRENRGKLINIAVIFSLMYMSQLFIGSLPKVLLNLLFLAIYASVLSVPKSWWSGKRLFLAFLIIVIEAMTVLFLFHEIKLIYFLATAILSISVRLSLSKPSILGMTVIFVTAVLYIHFGSEDPFSIVSFGMLSIVIYITIRNRIQRNEMYELDKLHLAQLQEAYEQLQEASVTAMQYAVLEERTRIAREIHDAVGHSLTSLIVQMQALRYMMKKEPEKAEKSLESMLVVARQGLHDIRISVHSLADDRSESGITPLKALLSRMEATASIQYEFDTVLNDEDIDVNIYGTLFKILQEAITNIIRHSQATMVYVRLTKEAGKIVMQIRDNGILQSSQPIHEGFGLKVMKERLEEQGGRLHYSAMEPHGFNIIAEVPMLD